MLQNEYRTWVSYFLGALALFSIISCTNPKGPAVNLGSGQSSTVPSLETGNPLGGGPVEAPSPTAVAVLQIGTVWEKMAAPCAFSGGASYEASGESGSKACDAVTTYFKTCEIPANSPDNTKVDCPVEIPEGQLYYSSLRFKFSVKAGQCAIVTWRPYYYKASNSATFSPEWGTSPIDCSDPDITKNPVDCFNGPAKLIGPEFPKYVALYQVFGRRGGEWNAMTAVANEINPKLSNRWSANNLSVNAKECRNANGGFQSVNMGFAEDGYVCRSMQDYQFVCQDEYLKKMFTMTIRVNDLDDISGSRVLDVNQKESWLEYSF